MPFFPKPDPKKAKPSKNLVLGNPESLDKWMDGFIEEHKELMEKLGRS